jgi:hypothetical protein
MIELGAPNKALEKLKDDARNTEAARQAKKHSRPLKKV